MLVADDASEAETNEDVAAEFLVAAKWRRVRRSKNGWSNSKRLNSGFMAKSKHRTTLLFRVPLPPNIVNRAGK
jgi:hypothetical protein